MLNSGHQDQCEISVPGMSIFMMGVDCLINGLTFFTNLHNNGPVTTHLNKGFGWSKMQIAPPLIFINLLFCSCTYSNVREFTVFHCEATFFKSPTDRLIFWRNFLKIFYKHWQPSCIMDVSKSGRPCIYIFQAFQKSKKSASLRLLMKEKSRDANSITWNQ